MADPNIIHTATAAVKCIPHIKTITHNIGVTKLTAVISTIIGSLIFGVIGYFIGKRGLTGTKTDISNAETAIQKVVTTAETVATPVAKV